MNNCEDNNKIKLELELNLKIEKEKTRQLELLKDIKKIEKSIKEKELYIKRNKSVCLSNFLKKNKKYVSDTESETESETETESEFDSESDNSESESDNCESETEYQKKDFILDCINIKCIKKKDIDTISISSLESDYDYDKEINVEI